MTVIMWVTYLSIWVCISYCAYVCVCMRMYVYVYVCHIVCIILSAFVNILCACFCCCDNMFCFIYVRVCMFAWSCMFVIYYLYYVCVCLSAFNSVYVAVSHYIQVFVYLCLCECSVMYTGLKMRNVTIGFELNVAVIETRSGKILQTHKYL